MKTKQTVGIIIAGIVFVCVCTCSLAANYFMNSIVGDVSSETVEPRGNYIGVINIEGTIAANDSSATSIFENSGYSQEFILDSIEDCEESNKNKGILLYVNSPGGSVNASDEVYLRLMKYKEETERPIWVYMGDEACSGGYYISMAGDKVIANRNTWTGSIGVYIALGNYSGLYEKLGIDEIYFTTGDNKTMGAGTEPISPEQEEIFQAMVDEPYQQFLDIIATGRPNLTMDQIKEAADGRIYTAKQALEIGLIDDIQSYDDAVDLMKEDIGKNLEMYEYEETSTYWEDILGSMQSFKGKSESEVMLDYIKNDGTGEAMYYAMPE